MAKPNTYLTLTSIIGAALLLSVEASADAGARLTNLEVKQDRLESYWNAKCASDGSSMKCKRVEMGIKQLDAQIAKAQDLLSSRGDSTIVTDKEVTDAQRQYATLILRLTKTEALIARLTAENNPDNSGEISSLSTQARIMRHRASKIAASWDS